MELVIFMGIQASGKSTFYRSRFTDSHMHVSKDNFPNAKNRSRRQAALIETAFQEGHSVVVDNTNPTVAERTELLELGRRWEAKIIGYYFESRPTASLERNRLREGKSRVPDVAIYSTLKNLERPSPDEGFHELYHVRLDDQNTFVVTEWQGEEHER